MKIMRKIYLYILTFFVGISNVFADDWLLEWVSWDIRKWEIHAKDIPLIIWNAIDFFMWIAWTIAIIFVIIWAYKILFWSVSWDTSKWKETIFAALIWFALAALSWLIMSFILENFTWSSL